MSKADDVFVGIKERCAKEWKDIQAGFIEAHPKAALDPNFLLTMSKVFEVGFTSGAIAMGEVVVADMKDVHDKDLLG